MPRKAGALARPKLKEFGVGGLCGEGGQVFEEMALQGIGKNLNAGAIELGEQLVVDAAGEAAGKAAGE